MDKSKPHRGSLINWKKHFFDVKAAKADYKESPGKGYLILGTFLEHPQFAGQSGNTSWVVKSRKTKTGYEIETRNSRYTLIGEGA